MAGPDADAVAAAIAKVKSKKTKKATGKGKTGGNGDSKASSGKGKPAMNRAGTSKRSAQASSIRAHNPVVPIVQQRAAAPKARTIPLGQQLKYVFDVAKARRTPLKYEVFKTEKDVDIGGALLEKLQRHAQLIVDEVSQTVAYQPKYALGSKDEVHRLIKQHPFGLLAVEIADAYPDARKHLDELHADDVIFECGSLEVPSSIVYPNFYKPPGGLPDENIRNLLFDIELPQQEEEIDKQLMAAGISKAKRSTQRLKMALIQDDRKPVKEKKRSRLRKVTNTHMEELFKQEMPGAIDG